MFFVINNFNIKFMKFVGNFCPFFQIKFMVTRNKKIGLFRVLKIFNSFTSKELESIKSPPINKAS